MENIIKKAIEVGWNSDLEYDENEIVLRLVLLDPLFWQALGKACGWGGNVNWVCTTDCDYYCNDCKLGFTKQTSRPDEFQGVNGTHIDCPKKAQTWKLNALKFHQINLTQSFDKAVNWLGELIK